MARNKTLKLRERKLDVPMILCVQAGKPLYGEPTIVTELLNATLVRTHKDKEFNTNFELFLKKSDIAKAQITEFYPNFQFRFNNKPNWFKGIYINFTKLIKTRPLTSYLLTYT